MSIVKVRELVRAFEKCTNADETNRVAADSTQFLQSLDKQSVGGFHTKLCASMCRVVYAADGQPCDHLLRSAGEENELSVIVENILTCPTVVATWLARRAKLLFSSNRIIFEQCRQLDNASLTPRQEHIIGSMCRIPDLIANALKSSLEPNLLPASLFTELAHTLIGNLDELYQAIRAGVSCSTVFPAAMVGRLALLGQKDVVIPVLVAGLEERTNSDPLWVRIAQALFSHIPDNSLESVLDSVMAYTNPSSSHPTAVRRLLGDIVLLNPKAKFFLTHKAFLVKVPSRRQVLFNLIGYLGDDKLTRTMLVEALLVLLEVWGNASSLRHMDHRQHMWLSQILMLSTQHLDDTDITPVRPKLQNSLMTAIQTHIDSPVVEIRQIGMAVGEHLMNWLQPGVAHPLVFEYEASNEVEELRKLTSPSAIQEELKTMCVSRPPLSSLSPSPSLQTSRFGEGLVKTATCTDVDSDDDLVPYAFGEDPDSNQPAAPRYLRTCLAILISPESPAHFESALGTVESLIRAFPPDMTEVAPEFVKVLLHLSDNYSLSDFEGLRHRAMVALAACCPQPVVPYLTDQLYAANYSIRQRIDVLEVISAAALELSTPHSSPHASSQKPLVLPSVNKPWESVVKERLKAKTRVISKGPARDIPTAVANRFAPVAPLFFFPLMRGYDKPVNTLDLLGEDSLVLGSLLHTLGVVIHAARYTPLLSRMAAALMDFLWALRYHPNVYVRQGILFAMAMMLDVTQDFGFFGQLEDELSEVVQWLKEITGNDSNKECRELARQSLSILKTSLEEVKLCSQ